MLSVFSRVCRKNILEKYAPRRRLCQGVSYEEFGDPRKVLKLKDVKMPELKRENQVLIKMLMAPINPADINMVEGTYHVRPELPAFVGNEGLGEIIEVGNGVANLKPGDWVVPKYTAFGTWRTHATAQTDELQQVPTDLPPLSLATFSVNPCTAYRLLKDFVSLQPGDIIIQNGGNSAVGQNVIQLAHQWGIKTINIVRNRPDIEELTEFLKELGADYIFTEEFSRSVEMRDFIKSLDCRPKLAFNCVGGQSATEILRHIGEDSSFVTYGGMSKKPVIVPTGVSIFKQVKILGYWNTLWNKKNEDTQEKRSMYEDLFDLIRNCKLLPPASDLVELSEYQDAVSKTMDNFTGLKKVFVMEKDFIE